MASATPLTPLLDRDESRQRLAHPLERLRRYIRIYVLLEGVAALAIYIALWFWLGMAIDYGFFKLFGVDWVQVLPVGLRGAVLALLVLSTMLLVVNRLVRRFFRDFRERALALVLERRFPGELGDRLITAVELADSVATDRAGFSRAMIEQTVRDAAERVDRLPIEDVFNWQRLRRAGMCIFALTLGVYLLVGAAYSLLAWSSPGAYVNHFGNTAGIWFERNILLHNTIWPRRVHLELVNFPESGELKIGRNAAAPALRVRALKWVVADPKAPEGWRAMTWQDLRPEYAGELPAPDLLPTEWRTWQMDRIENEIDRAGGQAALSADTVISLRSLFARMEERAAYPALARHFRKLEIPPAVMVYLQGATVRSDQSLKRQEDNEYAGVLSDLRESVRFTANGADYYTPYKKITVVPPPSLVELSADEDQPAYLYHRPPAGKAAAALRGLKHQFRDLPVSLSGSISRIDVPLGSDLTLHGKIDKSLVAPGGIHLRPRDNGSPVKETAKQLDEHAFEIHFANITAPIDFEIEFLDTDGVASRRAVSIKQTDDAPPEVDVQIEVIRKTSQGYLASVSARIPISGKARDDHGLSSLEYAYNLTGLEAQSLQVARPAVSALQYLSPRGPAFLSFPEYLTWIGGVTRALADDSLHRPQVAGIANFERRLRDAGEPPTAEELAKSLQERPTNVMLREYVFDPDEDAFDAQNLNLKIEDEHAVQPRYRLRLWVKATDNNVETGPGIGEGHEKFTIFLVSENELLLEIAPVEEALHVKLDDAVNRLKEGRSKLELVVQEMPALQPQEFSPIARRAEEIQETVMKSWDVTREVFIDYRNILKELQVNRVNPKYVDKVDKSICQPLDGIINQEFVRSDEALQALQKKLDDKKIDQQAAALAREQLDKLIEKLTQVLDAMRDITTINDLIKQLEDIKKHELQELDRFKQLKGRLEDEILNQGLDKR